MTENEAYGQAFENGRKVGDAEGYARGMRDAVKHGQWLHNPGNPSPYCSHCGNEPNHNEETDYCPDCGARMDGGEDR